MKNIYLFLLLTLSFVSLKAQTEESPSAAEQAFAAGDIQAAIRLQNETIEELYTQKSWEDFAIASASLSEFYMQTMDIENGLKAIDQSIQRLDGQDALLPIVYKAKGKLYYVNQDFVNSRQFLEKALNLREQQNPEDPELVKDYANMGIISSQFNAFPIAEKYLKKALEKNKDAALGPQLSFLLAQTYNNLTKYNAALELINGILNATDVNPMITTNARFLKITILQYQKNFKSAIIESNTALTFAKETGDVLILSEALSNSYQTLFIASQDDYVSQFDKDKLLTKVLETAEQSLQLIKDNAQISFSDNAQLGPLYYQALVYSTFKEFDKSIQTLQKLEKLSVNKDYHKNTLFAYSLVMKDQGNYDLAIGYAQRAIQLYFPTVRNNPALAQIKTVEDLVFVENLIAYKARVLYKSYKKSKNPIHLKRAYETLLLSDSIFQYSRNISDDKTLSSNLDLDAYESFQEILYALNKETPSAEYLEKAFYFSEKSKALSLLENLQSNASLDLLSEEEQAQLFSLRNEVNQLEQLQHQQNQKKASAEDKNQTQQALSEAKKNLQDYEDELAQSKPKYLASMQKLQMQSLQDIQATLKVDETMIEYFYADSNLYAFKITADTSQYIELVKSPTLSKKVNDFRGYIYNYYLSGGKKSKERYLEFANNYSTSAYELYQLLIEPLGSLNKNLTIIPAGTLNNLPFEALIKEKPQDPTKYGSYKYLLLDYAINYCYSANLLKNMQDKDYSTAKRKTYLGFAPSFGDEAAAVIRGKRYGFSPLLHNMREVEQVQLQLGTGDVFTALKATENQFKTVASDYRILHLATHGMANDQYPDYSLLAFTHQEDSIENELLYVKDLFTMNLQADLVMLSACETGIGKELRGEGIASMAKGFSQAGAKSIFTTLWSVNDMATSTIVKDFYTYLQEGKTKAEALRLAKLDFLEAIEGDDKPAHPFLWAPFILIGDNAAMPDLNTDSNIPWHYIAIGCIALFISLAFATRKKKA